MESLNLAYHAIKVKLVKIKRKKLWRVRRAGFRIMGPQCSNICNMRKCSFAPVVKWNFFREIQFNFAKRRVIPFCRDTLSPHIKISLKTRQKIVGTPLGLSIYEHTRQTVAYDNRRLRGTLKKCSVHPEFIKMINT